MENFFKGYDYETFTFEGSEAIIVFPKEKNSKGSWALKTEYWGAFPDPETCLLKRGFHLAGLKTKTRLATREDCDQKARFVRYISEHYGLDSKCSLVGMSCGGAQAVRFAGFYPELVTCMYIDAPVLNFCSFPGKPEYNSIWDKEFQAAYPGVQRYQLLHFTEHPLYMIDTLKEHRIPILMIVGLSDLTVPYDENGLWMEQAYEGSDLLTVTKIGARGHHPHGLLLDNEPIADFIEQHS